LHIAAVRHAVPSRRITNDDLFEGIRAANVDNLPAEELELALTRVRQFLRLAGTQVRYGLDDGESALELVTRAAEQAMAKANLEPDDVDFLIYTGVGRGWVEPAMANVVMAELGLNNATGFDILDACASWIQALRVARGLLMTGGGKRGLIVNAESAFENYLDLELASVEELEHKFAAFTVGEAVTATVVTDENADDDFVFRAKSFPEYFDLCMIPLAQADAFAPKPLDDRYKAGKFFSLSKELITITVEKIIELYGEWDDINTRGIDMLFGHQASEMASSIVRKRIGVDKERYYGTHTRFGNTVSASVPLGMSLAIEEGRLNRGDQVLVIVGSAGISVAMAAFTF
jgi:3-oxoacyl-[acyl-carrier-protein] synthase III